MDDNITTKFKRLKTLDIVFYIIIIAGFLGLAYVQKNYWRWVDLVIAAMLLVKMFQNVLNKTLYYSMLTIAIVAVVLIIVLNSV